MDLTSLLGQLQSVSLVEDSEEWGYKEMRARSLWAFFSCNIGLLWLIIPSIYVPSFSTFWNDMENTSVYKASMFLILGKLITCDVLHGKSLYILLSSWCVLCRYSLETQECICYHCSSRGICVLKLSLSMGFSGCLINEVVLSEVSWSSNKKGFPLI